MSEDIQSLLDRINAEGVEKAEAESAKIIADAKAQAAKIIADAKAQADKLAEEGAEKAAVNEMRAKEAIKQAARDILIALKSDLLAKLSAAVKECTSAALTEDVMGNIILEMAKGYVKDPRASELQLLLSRKDAESVEAILKKAFLASLKAKPVLNFTDDFNSGLQISFKENDVFFDFSDEALAEVLCKFVSPKLAEVIKNA
ncbi:MAG: hypothetical protein IKA79_07340 [Lentisphaeria bacterium]|nr:hypothetical protein [Lentisphaeria bacterium]